MSGNPRTKPLNAGGGYQKNILEDDNSASTNTRSRIRVVAQCKAEKKPIGPNYLRELEGVLYWHSTRDSSTGNHPLMGVFLSQSHYTGSTLTRAMESDMPLLLVHIPPLNPEEQVTLGDNSGLASQGASKGGIGSIVWNPALGSATGLLRGKSLVPRPKAIKLEPSCDREDRFRKAIEDEVLKREEEGAEKIYRNLQESERMVKRSNANDQGRGSTAGAGVGDYTKWKKELAAQGLELERTSTEREQPTDNNPKSTEGWYQNPGQTYGMSRLYDETQEDGEEKKEADG
ncbi:hypothetical protein D9758_005721 [Tetrapyrgos nigripes]|uniref:Uncharacterized protein n=1 Tax=Tetrapyrgos nigripes TaxID=182062 RepID=A0A8H5GK57_9AGAR|nr:hypothetical protein D9758_005721 [Tetrapyrgos nigripes]